MRTSTLLARSLTWYWRTNLAVLLGVAVATGVLGGALVVGDSVRASLRDLVLARLGNADTVVSRNGWFREALANDLGKACSLIAIDGVVAQERSGKRAAGVQIYGVDERFWKFQDEPGEAPRSRQAFLSVSLSRELGAADGDSILLRVEKPQAIPLESLHGRKEDVGKSIRLTMKTVEFREFSLRPQQGDLRAVFVPLSRLQRDLEAEGKVNTILAAGNPKLAQDLKDRFTLEDLGLKLRTLDKQQRLSLESDSALIGDAVAEAAAATAKAEGLSVQPVFTYLANGIQDGSQEIPYSVVTALEGPLAPAEPDGITLNQWAARELNAKPGDPVTLSYFVWKSDGRLHTDTAQFRLSKIVPIEGAAADRDYTPDYPGITESDSLHDWDPPFPIDLKRVHPSDEQYWKQYRTTPKAFIPLARGQQLWGTRFGRLTSIRISPPSPGYAAALRAALDPAKMGLTVFDVKAQDLAAAHGATDFGEYFVYFSFFLMVSALLLTGLFFKLGIEQRTREIGVMRALGYSMGKLRSLFLLEGGILAIAGAIAGVLAALVYGALVMYGLRTWWVDAVGTRLLTLHASVPALGVGAAAGVITGLGSIAWTLRGLRPVTPRGLLLGEQKPRSPRRRWMAGGIATVLGLGCLAAAPDQTARFFGAGTLLLIASLFFVSAWLNGRTGSVGGEFTLGLRSASYRPGRSVLCIALIASATFLIVALDAFRSGDTSAGAGGYPFVAESVLPLIHDPNTTSGREALNMTSVQGVQFVNFRLRAGDDASCLNLYQPRNPRIIGVPAAFLRSAHFAFQDTVEKTANPWLLLESRQSGGAIPAIADATSLEYTLHLKLGEEFTLDQRRYRIVATVQDSIFQGELLISENNFLRVFPDIEGYRFFLLRAPSAVVPELESALSDYGLHVQPTAARLAAFHKVENTYLSTFRSLGTLGLILGTVGLAAILLRNVLERRRELALLRAVGYRPANLRTMVLAENMLLLVLGLAAGTVCALVAIAPALAQRGTGHLPIASLVLLLAVIAVTGAVASLLATATALRSPLLAALRSE
jgi:ABC-type lipoprotein release transport system permease subunit